MSKRSIVLVVALLLAALSAFAVLSFLRGVEDNAAAEIQPVPVFRATQRIEAGVTGSEALRFIEESEEPEKFRPSLAVATREELNEVVAGKLTAGPISEGQIITSDVWVEPVEVETRRLSEFISPGMVAVSIQPDKVSAVGGFVRPGDRVNLVASQTLSLSAFVELLSDPELREFFLGIPATELPDPVQIGTDEDGNPILIPPETDVQTLVSGIPSSVQFTQTILQNVEILAVGPSVRDVSTDTGLVPVDGSIMTFEVTPDVAEQILFADQYTTIDLVLVREDYAEVETNGVIVDDLFSIVDRYLALLEENSASQ